MNTNEDGLIKVGYWHSDAEPELPKPQATSWLPEAKKDVVSYLKEGEQYAQYRGMSTCRICGEFNGSQDLTDGVYVWPSGLAHYVDEHDTALPSTFVNHVLDKVRVRDGGTGWVEYLVAFDDRRWDTTIEQVPQLTINKGRDACRSYAEETFARQAQYRNTVLWSVYSFPNPDDME